MEIVELILPIDPGIEHRLHFRFDHRCLANGNSKGHKHHVAMQAIFFAFYNFCRKHEAIGGQTPAMADGLTDKAWTIKQLLEQAAGV